MAPTGVLVYDIVDMSSTTESEDRSLSEIGAFVSPFDYDDADVTLRSSDKLDFHVHKLILSTSSPLFKSMFSLPQTDATVSLNQKPIIDLPENSKTIGALLTRIYPTPIPGGPEVTVSVVPLNQEPGAIFPTAGVCSITTKSPTVVWEVPARLRPEKGSS